MLERLRIQNFKSWQDTGDLAFGSLTGFFGTNSSGKSSILQFLLMLKQTVESFDRNRVLNLGDDSTYVNLGTMQDIINQRQEIGTISFSLHWNVQLYSQFTESGYTHFSYEPQLLNFEASVRIQSDKTFLQSFIYRLNGTELGIKRTSNPILPGMTYTVFAKNIELKNPEHNADLFLSKPNRFYGFPHEIDLHVSDIWFTRELGVGLEKLFDNIFYLGPLRDYPRRTYLWSGEDTSGVGSRGENAIAALLSSRVHDNISERDEVSLPYNVEEHVAHWLKELGLIYSFKMQPIAPGRKEYEVRIQRTAESASVFLTDVGFGVSQILPVLVLLFYVPEGSTVILEQPEIHLHPAVQAGLADVFIDAIKRRKLQIILESHSEHLLQRLQLRMAEKGLNPEKEFDSNLAKLYFTSIEEGKSKLTKLQLDDYGNINNWPEGFFGDAFGEAAAMMKAEMKRKMQQSK